MQSYDISVRKEFMSKLLKSDLFDHFEVREVIIHNAFKIVLDGKRNMDYFDLDSKENLSFYLNWYEVKKKVYELMQGRTLPTYFKIILSTNLEETLVLSPHASTFFLNIQFKDNQVNCSTGTAYKSFILDQSADQLWDEHIKKFLFEHQFM